MYTCLQDKCGMLIGEVRFSSVQFSRSVVSNSATPWTTARQASLSITNSGVYPNSCPSSQWCNPAISSSVVPFSSCPQSFPASGSFQMSQPFSWGGQSIGVSADVEHPGLISFKMVWLDLLAVQGTLKSFLQHHSSKASILQFTVQFFSAQLSSQSNSHIHTWPPEKP